MASADPHSSLSETNRHCVVLGGERGDPEEIASAAAQMGFADAQAFDADQWFSAPLSAPAHVTPIIVLDAAEGIGDQDRHFARQVKFLDLGAPVVLVANLALIGYEQEQFELIQEEFQDVLSAVNLTPSYFGPLPLGRPDLIPWWQDNGSLAARRTSSVAASPPPLRMKVISSTNDDGRWIVTGKTISGAISAGDEILCSPSNQLSVVASVEETEKDVLKLTFDTPHFAEPGEVVSHQEKPPIETDVFRVKAIWRADQRTQGDGVLVETSYGRTQGTIQSVEQILSPSTFKTAPDTEIANGALVEIIVRVDNVIALDHIGNLPHAAEVTLLEPNQGSGLLATGYISMEGYADQRHLLTSKAVNTTPIEFSVGESDRSARNGHEGGVLWFTGLSGAGKSTLAVALEARLFEKGYQVFVLDGDNVRQGLTSNLGFSPDDRSENIRRVGEVAALFRQAGVIVISSFISPYRSDRDRARHAAYSSFHEIYIKADIETCIDRDPKGLYERALKGEIPDFTGISAPYEAPDAPELVVDTGAATIDACVEKLVNYVDRNFRV
ncbi:MAG: adenylyl-sulfate kinase [Parvibaculaceae bacterium]|nr:adenylyl-sulfate kinase [Parvibaculaceae bacterium]